MILGARDICGQNLSGFVRSQLGMAKTDFKKSIASYRAKKDHFDILEVETMQYLMLDGGGAPGSETYSDALKSLYPAAYTLKFASKQTMKNYVVPPLEGLWWAEDMNAFTEKGRMDEWKWTLLIMTPNWISQDMLTAAKKKLAPKSLRSLSQLRLESLREGLCVQTLHVGSYSNEGPLLERMHYDFIPAQNLEMSGKHHEIYLNDPRRVASEKLKTILRQPVIKSQPAP